MGEGINDCTNNIVDLRRHMWMDGVEVELRRLIWQIAVVGKYISAKIHESNRKLAGFKNIYGEEQLALDRITDDILKNKLQPLCFRRIGRHRCHRQRAGKVYCHSRSPGRIIAGGYQSGHRHDHRHPPEIHF